MAALTATMRGPRCSACLLQLVRSRPYATHAPKGRSTPARPPSDEGTTTAHKPAKSPLTEMLDIFVPLTNAQKASIAGVGSSKQPKHPKKRPAPPPPSAAQPHAPVKTLAASSTVSLHPHKSVQPPLSPTPKDNAGRSTNKEFRAVLDSVLPADKPQPRPPLPAKKKAEPAPVPIAVARAREKAPKDRTIFESYLGASHAPFLPFNRSRTDSQVHPSHSCVDAPQALARGRRVRCAWPVPGRRTGACRGRASSRMGGTEKAADGQCGRAGQNCRSWAVGLASIEQDTRNCQRTVEVMP